MSKRLRKSLVLLVCGLFALAILASFALAVAHTGHCCQPKACPVCHQINAMRSLLGQLALALLLLLGVKLPHARSWLGAGAAKVPPRFASLISLNVRMNN